MKGTARIMLLAVLSLCGCPPTTAASVHTDDFPAIVDDFPGYFAELEKNKPINWTSVLDLLSTGQISPTCYSHTYIVHNDTTLVKSYAQFMLDSTGKLTPSGVFEGNWLDIGNYKECTTDANNAVDRPEGIQAMYCLVSWAKTPEAAALNLYDSDANFRQGVCVPKSCSESEVQDLTETANKVEKTEDGKQWWFLIVRGNYDMAVDTFLLLRLTPVLALLIMIFTCLIAYMGSGPWWAIRDNFTMDFVQNCEKYWWANLLYINNFVGQRCFTHGWYLGADMQLYVTLTGLLVVLYSVNGESYSYTTYRWSFTRMAPYIIGILLGYLLFRTNRKVPDTPKTRGLMLLGWIVGTACALVAFFTPFGAPEANLLGHPAWKAFERSLFATGVAWVVYACCVGYGGIITEFLSWSGWLPLSRLTYTAYIIHPIIIQAYYMAYRGPRLYSSLTWWFMFVSFSFMSLVCGFAASMMAEAPFLELEKILLPNRRDREAKHETTAEDGHDSMAMKAGIVITVQCTCVRKLSVAQTHHCHPMTARAPLVPMDVRTDFNIPVCSCKGNSHGTINMERHYRLGPGGIDLR
uniref:Nose resistant-to-fluoxetine protein N-terminal domain-containing protein n=1 Tax=Branchiostoma floridae TaxID=7739 RepID=C3ZP80_BRAFL|eukprot:XP_002589566.1 hypothetical protein BRAFLDRAFT_81523 [Branchiostoma floridae]